MFKHIVASIGILMVMSIWSPSQAETSSKVKNAFYGSCFTSCIEKQKNAPENKASLDTPFEFDGYCSCMCTRIAMKASNNYLDKLYRAKQKGLSASEVSSIPEIKQMTSSAAQACLKGIYGD